MKILGLTLETKKTTYKVYVYKDKVQLVDLNRDYVDTYPVDVSLDKIVMDIRKMELNGE